MVEQVNPKYFLRGVASTRGRRKSRGLPGVVGASLKQY